MVQYRCGGPRSPGRQSQSPVIARRLEPVPVTDRAREAAIEALARFRRVGGRIDLSRIPRARPALQGFFLDEADRIWTLLTTDGTDRVMEIHDADGAFLRRITLPVVLRSSPQPIVRGNLLYGVEFDELDVPYVVVLRIDL